MHALYTMAMHKTRFVLLGLSGIAFALFSCASHVAINYFVEYRVNDSSMGSVFDADPDLPHGYTATTHNKYQTVNWGDNAAGVVAVPKDGFTFSHWEKYVVVVTANDFIMTLVTAEEAETPARTERSLYDNLILIANFVEAAA